MKNDIRINIVMLSQLGKQDGGRETWLYNFLPELLKNETIAHVTVYGYRLHSENDNTAALESQKVTPIILSGEKKKWPRFVDFLFKLKSFKANHPDTNADYTIAVGGLLEALVVFFNSGFKKSKKIVWLRTIFTQEKSYRIPAFFITLLKSFENYILKKADIIIANGDDTKIYYNQYGLKIETIKNAIYTEKWEMPPVNISHPINISYIGRLSKVKGIEPFIEVAKHFKNSIHKESFNFHVVGEANDYEQEVELLSKNGIITYHGAKQNDDIPTFLYTMDVSVALTFVSERGGGSGLSNALLEQMAAGRIIIAWDNNAFNQILDNECAYIVEQYSVEGLKMALLEILNFPEIAKSKAAMAKLKVAPYTMKAHVERFIKLTFKDE